MKWNKDTITITPPKAPKKLTGTRFATVLGLNPWATEFEIWCEITKTYQKPFEDTIYTIAGKTIEPKQAEYMRKNYFMRNLKTPEDVFGKDYFNKTFGNFFDHPILGGMWDYLNTDGEGNITEVLEMKTTKRAEDWQNGIPEYYALQAALYAYLLGVDSVVMVCTILEDKDYEHPEKFNVTAENTLVRSFLVSERYPEFENTHINPAIAWYQRTVEKGKSPKWDEKKDAEILNALRTKVIDPSKTEITDVIKEAEVLKAEIEAKKAELKEPEDRLKTLLDAIKNHITGAMGEDDDKGEITGNSFKFTLSKSVKKVLDEEQMKKDGIYDKYCTKEKTTLTLRTSGLKEE